MEVKDTNPKDSVGSRKWRQFSVIPFTVLWVLGLAFLEGARKYGRHNYRIAGVRASVYVDAAMGHIASWWEGEDMDAESQLCHIAKAMASLAVLYDGIERGRYVDDRPPKLHNYDEIVARHQAAVNSIFERIPEAKGAYTQADQPKQEPVHIDPIANALKLETQERRLAKHVGHLPD